MKRIILIFTIIISCACAKADDIQRTFWGCTLGETSYQQALDTITAQEKREYKIPKTEDNEITLTDKWWMKYVFDHITLSFKDDRLFSVHFTKECYDLSTSDELSREIVEKLSAKWGDFIIKNGLAKINDKNTEVKLSVTTQQDKGSLFEILFINLK